MSNKRKAKSVDSEDDGGDENYYESSRQSKKAKYSASQRAIGEDSSDNNDSGGDDDYDEEDQFNFLPIQTKKRDDSSDSDIPLSEMKKKTSPAPKKPAPKSKPESDDSDSDSDVPLSVLKSKNDKKTQKDKSKNEKGKDEKASKSKAKKEVKKEVKKEESSDDDDDDDIPLNQLLPKRSSTASTKQSKVTKKEESDESSSESSDESSSESSNDSDESTKKKKNGTKKKATKKNVSKPDSDSDTPLDQLQKKNAAKKEEQETPKKPRKRKLLPSITPKKEDTPEKKKQKKNILEEIQVHAWWEEDKKLPEGQKWRTLEHNGILFPPPYVPHGVKLKYDGKDVDLTPEQEEAASWYAAMLDTDYAKKPKFNENFMNDFKKLLNDGDGPKHVIRSLDKCDFRPIYDYLKAKHEEKKARPKEEKDIEKKEKEALREKYGTAIVDGVTEKIANFTMEPPGLFRGRGEHPRMGCIKRRIQPEDVTINIGKDAKVPECPVPGHRWGQVVHRPNVTWLAFWKDPVMNEFKYVFLAASSRFRGEKDLAKFEKARYLKKYINSIRDHYTRSLKSEVLEEAQLGTALWVIDRLALRVGNEKDTEEEADTVGCCTLRVEHVKLLEDNVAELDFLGKDSIRYCNSVKFDPLVYKNFKKFMHNKGPTDDVFDTLTPTKLNKHLASLMKGLSAKVFRTYNASVTLEKCLLNDEEVTKKAALDGEKIVLYNRANREVAILCNHQRATPKNFSQQIEKMEEKIQAASKAQSEAERELRELQSIIKNKLAREIVVAAKEEDEEPVKKLITPEVAEKRLDLAAKKVERAKARVSNLSSQRTTKEDQKTVALGTSKINYCDPRITVSWCKRHDVPLQKIFNRSLLAKFPWAFKNPDVDEDWRF